MLQRRAALFGTVLLLVVAATTAGWAGTGAESQAQKIQEETQSFDVTNLTAPPSVTAGETVTVSATVIYEPDAGANETETPGETTETGTATEGEVNETATEGAANETATEGAANGTATATAEGAVTQSVEFRVRGDVVERQEVTLAPGESTTVTFELDTTEVPPGVYIHGIYTEDYGEVATLIVQQDTGGTDEEMTPTATETEMPETNVTATPGAETGTPTAAETATADGTETA